MEFRQTRAFLPSVIAAVLALASACLTPVPWPAVKEGPCAEKNGGCDSNAICSVATGATAATCVCKATFSGDGQSCACAAMGAVVVDGGAGGGTCVDDACATDNGGCDPNATCANSADGPVCTCNTGYTGDGQSCTVVPVDAGDLDGSVGDGGDLDGSVGDGGDLDGGDLDGSVSDGG